jgi:hypothetical protein
MRYAALTHPTQRLGFIKSTILSLSLQEPGWQIALVCRPTALVNCPSQKLLQRPEQRHYCRNDVDDGKKTPLFSHGILYQFDCCS